MIGIGSRQGNLYVLDSTSLLSKLSKVLASCNIVSLSQSELWHCRMGHPSYIKLQVLQNELQVSNVSYHSPHCSICHLAKQHCLPSISSNTLFASPFDLIHCDIRGPFHVMTIEGFSLFLYHC